MSLLRKIVCSILLVCVLTSCGGSKSMLDDYVKMSHQDYLDKYDDLTDTNHVFESISYYDVFNKVDNKDTFILYVGGAWCNNCQAVAPLINEQIALNGYTVYNFDTRMIYDSKPSDIRNCMTKEAEQLYKNFIDKIGYVNPNGDTVVVEEYDTKIDRMPVPTVIAFKNGKLVDFVTKEYEYGSMTDTDKLEYKTLLQLLVDDLNK